MKASQRYKTIDPHALADKAQYDDTTVVGMARVAYEAATTGDNSITRLAVAVSYIPRLIQIIEDSQKRAAP